MVFEDLLVDISSPVQEEILRELEKALGVKVDRPIPAHAQTNGDAIVAIGEENTIDALKDQSDRARRSYSLYQMFYDMIYRVRTPD